MRMHVELDCRHAQLGQPLEHSLGGGLERAQWEA